MDILLGYSFMTIVRWFHYLASSSWTRVTANITGHDYNLVIGYYAKLDYKFELNERLIKGSDRVPFLTSMEAEEYAASFPHNTPRIIRVNPNNPKKTRFFESDQQSQN